MEYNELVIFRYIFYSNVFSLKIVLANFSPSDCFQLVVKIISVKKIVMTKFSADLV